MKEVLAPYVPDHALDGVFELIRLNQVRLKIVNERKTRHGDYRKNSDGTHTITVNASLNKYKFLMTLIHELAHLVAFKKFGHSIKPHGMEWKFTYQQMMLPYLRPEIFPHEILPLMARHFKNPTASSDTDASLFLALKQFDAKSDLYYVFELPQGAFFRVSSGKIFRKGPLRIKRYECVEVSTQRRFAFSPNAEVELLPS